MGSMQVRSTWEAVGGDITFMGIATEPETEGVERTVSSDISVGSLGGSLIFGSETDTGDVNYSGIFNDLFDGLRGATSFW